MRKEYMEITGFHYIRIYDLPWFLVNAGKSLFGLRPYKSTMLLPF